MEFLYLQQIKTEFKMKKVITVVAIVMVSVANAQAFKGKGDIKAQVGMNVQSHGTGINVSADFGDRADAKVRFNANLGNVFKLDKTMDIYPGLDLGTRNFGAHLGFRYFFTEGFGVYTEAGVPLARYDSNVEGFDEYNNQFVFQIGASFNL